MVGLRLPPAGASLVYGQNVMADSAQETPRPRRRDGQNRQLPWREDLVVLVRLLEVEKRHLAGHPNRLIAAALGVDEKTIRDDLKRLKALWLERIKGTQEELRGKKVAELADIKQRSIAAAEWDQDCERAVLYGETIPDDNGGARSVYRDEKGSATFRGQKAQALNVARQAVMDQAKILGLVVDKQELSGKDGGAVPIRLVEVVPPDGGDGDRAQD